MGGIRIDLELGPRNPAPSWMLQALDGVHVEQSDQCPNAFTLTFLAPRTPSSYADKQLLASGLLNAGARVIISATLTNSTSVLMDGFVTHISLQAATPKQEARVVVTGEDVSFQMALYEYSMEYPLLGDAAIATLVLAKWLALGIVPEVIPTPTSLVSFEDVPQQVGNDRDYLQSLAQQHGYVFYVSPGPTSGLNQAYWGPPKTFVSPQPALTVDSGSDTNVEALNFDFDATKPQRVWGAVLDTTIDTELPILTITGTRVPPLAAKPALLVDFPYVRTTLFQHQGLDVAQAYAKAQAITDLSTDRVVTGSGSLDALRYGRPLTAPGVVGVRGVGATFDGNYYVQKVSHDITRQSWKQGFELQREGLGSTVTRVSV